MRARLRIEKDGKSRTFLLKEGCHTLGRGEAADLRLDDDAASREHLLLHVGQEIRVEDLGSRNGTYLGGRRLRGKAAWAPGETLVVGGTSLLLERVGGPVVEPRRWGLPRRLEPIFVGGLLLLLLLFLALVMGEAPERTAGVLHLAEEEARGRVIGWDEEVELRARRLELEWRPQRPLDDALVWLRLGVEAPPAGLELRLNGVEIATWRPGGESWKRILLPARLLDEGANLLVFSPLEEDEWAIWDLRVEEEPRPQCRREACVEEASRLISQGRSLVERQALDPGNSYAAWVAFHRARILLEGLDPKPELYTTAVALLEETEAALDTACRQLRFSVVQRLAFGREALALDLARRMLRTFPEDEHPCHERALDFVERLEAAGGPR